MAKKTPTPEELEEIRVLVDGVRKDIQQLCRYLQAQLDARVQ